MQSIIENLAALGRPRLIALGATGLGLITALLVGLNLVLAPNFAPLYSDLSLATAGRVVAALEQDGVPVELSGGGTIVSVPQDDVARARMSLAEQGLPGEGGAGWEIFDQSSGLGMNSFMQQVSRLRALEGELARSIQTIDGIDAARVHLVLPEREAFSRTRPEPSASVIVRGRATSSISRRQGSRSARSWPRPCRTSRRRASPCCRPAARRSCRRRPRATRACRRRAPRCRSGCSARSPKCSRRASARATRGCRSMSTSRQSGR
ncbi:hypothetical protein [Limimaricola cinnabarinus]|uniref:hypothetical protein n=1 Tax=Limimaricola cinnabarinus TaxID=1125964 RepID=UPI001F352F63|nr:hypothetical protein [Limimaricola cinnabarinus]